MSTFRSDDGVFGVSTWRWFGMFRRMRMYSQVKSMSRLPTDLHRALLGPRSEKNEELMEIADFRWVTF
jgi:hypothetical protein